MNRIASDLRGGCAKTDENMHENMPAPPDGTNPVERDTKLATLLVHNTPPAVLKGLAKAKLVTVGDVLDAHARTGKGIWEILRAVDGLEGPALFALGDAIIDAEARASTPIAELLEAAGISDAVTAKLRARGLDTWESIKRWCETPVSVPGSPARFQSLADLPGITAKQAKRIVEALAAPLQPATEEASHE